eukprot:Amastigsp_a514613_5.p2 type:complete len:133 gc:universal Amastigsp_a514613_5:303-701(+)
MALQRDRAHSPLPACNLDPASNRDRDRRHRDDIPLARREQRAAADPCSDSGDHHRNDDSLWLWVCCNSHRRGVKGRAHGHVRQRPHHCALVGRRHLLQQPPEQTSPPRRGRRTRSRAPKLQGPCRCAGAVVP